MVEKIENSSSVPDFITSPELEEGIRNASITTFTICGESLSDYQDAASMTNFEVKVIAGPGQFYITDHTNPPKRILMNTNGQENKTPTITAVKSQDPVRKDYVGISLKRPPGVTNDTPFHIALQKIQRI